MASALHRRRRRGEKAFVIVTLISCLVPLVAFVALMVSLFWQANVGAPNESPWSHNPTDSAGFISPHDPTSVPTSVNTTITMPLPSEVRDAGALWPGIKASLLLLLLAAGFAVPLGIGAAIYLEVYADDNRFFGFIEGTIKNLSGVPSIVYGVVGLGVFVSHWGPGDSSLVPNALILALLMLPLVILAARRSIRAIPRRLRDAGEALGASRLQTTRRIILPLAWPGMVIGVIGALARAVGEVAPLILIGGLLTQTMSAGGAPQFATDEALPVRIFAWLSHPQFRANAAAGILVLIIALVALNALAIVLRKRKRVRYA